MTERRLRRVLFLLALALVCWGCPKIEFKPAEPSPEPPVTTTTTQPPVVPTPGPIVPTPEPTPTPASSACPKPLAPGAYAYVNAKPYGQGLDSEPRVYGDEEFCKAIHGVPARSCHLEGWAKRVECEMELLGGCPVWQWAPSADGPWQPAHQAAHPVLSVDHFGNTVDRDDPVTRTVFEGKPEACGKQRDERQDPVAGFFVIAHGRAFVRACKADGTGCGKSVEVDH